MCLLVCNAFAQEDTYGRISINAFVPDDDNIPAEAARNLENKLKRMITTYGMADNGISERFIVTAKADITSKDILPTTPAKVSQKMDLTLYIGDIIENRVYSTTCLSVAGIGVNETKAFISAFQRLQLNTPKIQEFVEVAKQRIVDYYTSNCEAIIAESQRLAKSQQYDEAIYQLIQVPNICTDCFNRCQDAAAEIYQQKIDHDGTQLLHQAKNTWLTKKNYEAAEEALDLLSQIDIQSSALKDANAFADEINSKLRADEKREWEFKMKQYADQQAQKQREWEFKVQEQANSHERSLASIEMFKSIGNAVASNLPRTINKTKIIRAW